MILAIIILSILCILLFVGCIFLIAALKNILNELDKTIEESMEQEIYPCHLIITINYGKPIGQIITDFSKYNSSGIIGMVVDKVEPPMGKVESAMNGQVMNFPVAAVYKTIGGNWLWKYWS